MWIIISNFCANGCLTLVQYIVEALYYIVYTTVWLAVVFNLSYYKRSYYKRVGRLFLDTWKPTRTIQGTQERAKRHWRYGGHRALAGYDCSIMVIPVKIVSEYCVVIGSQDLLENHILLNRDDLRFIVLSFNPTNSHFGLTKRASWVDHTCFW